VSEAGGQLADSGTVTFSLTWNDNVDLDIHCALPNGNQCMFNNKDPTDWISLDVDKRETDKGSQVENIILKTTECDDGLY